MGFTAALAPPATARVIRYFFQRPAPRQPPSHLAHFVCAGGHRTEPHCGCGGVRGDGPVQLPYLTIYVPTYGREYSVSSPQTDTTNQQRATSETKQTPKAHQIQLRGEGFLVLLAAPPPRAARVGSSGGGGYFDVGSPASWRFKKRKELPQPLTCRATTKVLLWHG